MAETINVTNFSSDFLKKKITTTATEEPSSFDIRITSKIVAKFNLEIRLGLDIGFIENGRVKITQNDSQTIFDDNDISGLQEINTGTLQLTNADFVDIKIWNTVGGTFDAIAMIFINSTSDGTFVDPLALLEATSRTETLLSGATPLASSPITQDFTMNGYKSLILTMGTKTGLPSGISVHEDLSAWGNPENMLLRSNSSTLPGSQTLDEQIILDCGESVTGELVIAARETGGGTGHVEIETSTDDITYTPQLITGTVTSTQEIFTVGSSKTFRYIKVIAAVDSGTTSFQFDSVGLKDFLETEVLIKFQKSDDDGATWNDFIVATEYDTELDINDEIAEVFTISRDNPSVTSTVYIFPQGSNKLRIHITLTLYGGTTDTNTVAGYGGLVTIEKLN